MSGFFEKQHQNRLDQFNKASKGKTKEEKRALEQQMLRPEKVVVPLTNDATTDLDKRTIMMVFPDKASFDLFVKHFPIRTCGGNNLADMDGFMQELKLIDQKKRLNERFKNRKGGNSADVDFMAGNDPYIKT